MRQHLSFGCMGVEDEGDADLEPAIAVAHAFKEAITRRDADALAVLMTEDHSFVDSANKVFAGSRRSVEGLARLFEAFPDYRNVWSDIRSRHRLLDTDRAFGLPERAPYWTAQRSGQCESAPTECQSGAFTTTPLRSEPSWGPFPVAQERCRKRHRGLGVGPSPWRLLSLIASVPEGEVCACDLNDPLQRSQATVSHHLSVLVKAGLITREQRGKWAWFAIAADRANFVRSVLGGEPLVSVS